jgi:hypothetical protein
LVTRGRLTHIEDREEVLYARIRGERHPLRAMADLLRQVSRGVDDPLRAGILRALDDEVARFDEVVSVVEEVAERVFRGRAESRVTAVYGGRTRWEYVPPSRDYPYASQLISYGLRYGKVLHETKLMLELTINTERRSASLRATAYVDLLALRSELRESEEGRLFIAFLDELAGVFGVRDIRFGSAELYSRRRVVRGAWGA